MRRYLSRMRVRFRTKGKTIIYRAIVIAFCFAIIFVALLLLMGRLDYFPGYELIYRTPLG